MRMLLFVSGLILGIGTAQSAPLDSSDKGAAKQAMGAEQARVDALDRSDVAKLDEILNDNLTYVHASGKVDTKTSLLDAIRSGQLHYISWKLMNINVRITSEIGDTAVLNGEYAVDVKDTRVQPDPFHVSVFFLTVYEKFGGQWQQVAWQSTRDVAQSPAH